MIQRQLAFVLALALILRVVWAWLVPVEPVSDSWLYREFARNIAEGRGFSYPDGTLTAYWPVGTPAVYAALYAVFGVEAWPIVALNTLIGVAIVALTYVLGARWLGRQVGFFAALLVAGWPLLIQFTTVLASELLFTALLLGALATQAGVKRTALRDLGQGILLAAATLVRPTALALFFLLPLVQYLLERRSGEALRNLAFGALALVIVIGPWAMRNYELFGSPVLVSTNFGPNLWMGNNPESNGGYMALPEDRKFANEVERERYFKGLAVAYIVEDPVRYLRMSAKRWIATHERETIGIHWNEPSLRALLSEQRIWWLKLISTAYWWLAGIGAVAGALYCLGRRSLPVVHPLFAVGAFLTTVPALTVAQDRYHMPLIPFVAILAAVLIVTWTQRRS